MIEIKRSHSFPDEFYPFSNNSQYDDPVGKFALVSEV